MGLIKWFDRPVLLFVNKNLYWFLDHGDCIDHSLSLSPLPYFGLTCHGVSCILLHLVFCGGNSQNAKESQNLQKLFVVNEICYAVIHYWVHQIICFYVNCNISLVVEVAVDTG